MKYEKYEQIVERNVDLKYNGLLEIAEKKS